MYRKRSGFSLLEVMVASAVLFGSMLVLVQLAGVGEAHLRKSRTRSQARVLCQNKLNEVLSGIVPLESAGFSPFFEAPDWTFAIDVQATGFSNLVAVTVTVNPVQDESNAMLRLPDGPKHSFRLIRWIRPPQPAAGEVASPARLGSSSDRL